MCFDSADKVHLEPIMPVLIVAVLHITPAVKLTPSDLEAKDWAFLKEWANRLGVSLEELLKRILIAAAIGQLYAEKIPEI